MTTHKKPEYYETPLTDRKAIADFIFDKTHQRYYDHRSHPFCFNVKCYDYDVSFDHLLALYKEQEGDEKFFKSKEWLAAVKAKYDEIGGEETVYQWGLEDACRYLVSGPDGYPDGDTHRTLWDGTELDVKYSFEGRSGGWLSIVEFEGFKVNRDMGEAEWREVLEGTNDYTEMSYETLLKLYALVTHLIHDVRPEAVKSEIEYQAAFNFFENACSDIRKPEFIQPSLFPDE